MTGSLAVIRRRMDVLRADLPRSIEDIEVLAGRRHDPEAGPLAVKASLYLCLCAVILCTQLYPLLPRYAYSHQVEWDELEWAWHLLESEYGPDVGIRPLQELRLAGR